MNASTSTNKIQKAGSGRGKTAGKAQTQEVPSRRTGNAPMGSKTRAKHRSRAVKTRQKEQAKGSEDGTDGPMAEETRRRAVSPRDKANDPAEPPGQHLRWAPRVL